MTGWGSIPIYNWIFQVCKEKCGFTQTKTLPKARNIRIIRRMPLPQNIISPENFWLEDDPTSSHDLKKSDATGWTLGRDAHFASSSLETTLENWKKTCITKGLIEHLAIFVDFIHGNAWCEHGGLHDATPKTDAFQNALETQPFKAHSCRVCVYFLDHLGCKSALTSILWTPQKNIIQYPSNPCMV